MKKRRFQIARHVTLVSCLILLSIVSLSSQLKAEAATYPLKLDILQTTKKLPQLGRGSIWDLQWRADGSQLAVCGSSGIWLYDPLLRGTNFNKDQACLSVSWSPTGQQLAAVDDDGIAKVYDPKNGVTLLTLGSNDLHLTIVAWSSDGSRIVALAAKTFYVFNAQTGQVLSTYAPGYAIVSVLWSPDNRYFASAGVTGHVTIWNVKSVAAKKTIDTGITTPIYDMAWNTTDDTLAIGVNDRIELWDSKQDTITEIIQGNPNKIDSFAFGANGLLAVGLDSGGIQIWDIATHTLKTTLGDSSRSALLLQWSYKGLIASLDQDDKLQLWDSATGRLVAETDEHNEPIKAVTWKPDGKQIAGVEQPFAAASLRVWDITTKQLAFIAETPKGGASAPIAWSPTGDTIAGMASVGNVIIWDSSRGNIIKTLNNPIGEVSVLAWNSHGDRIAIGMLDTVLIWNVKLNQLDHRIDVSRTTDTVQTSVTSIAWSPDQTRLAIASEDGTVRIAEIANQHIVLSLQVNQSEAGIGNYSVRWSADNNHVVSDQGIVDIATGKLSKTFYFDADSIELNSNGTTFALTQEQSIQILNIKSGSTLNIQNGGWRDITSVTWSTDNSTLAITSSDGLIYIEPTTKP